MHLTTSNNSYHCNYCHKDGHTEDRCYKKKRDKQNGMSSSASTETALCVYETALILRAKEGYINDTIFIADIGASSYMVCSKQYLTDLQPIKSEVFVGSDQLVFCTKKGSYGGFLKNRFGKNILIRLQYVIYVPSLTVSLLSITKCISKHGVQFYS
jgi:hypothetical protein